MISKLIKFLSIIVIFVIAAGVSAYLTLTWIVKSEAIVVVPSLGQKDMIHALQMLSDLGLNTRIKASEYSDTIPANHVITQDPAPGSEIKKGRNVTLIVSKGPLSVTAPDLTGLSISQALIVLEENGLCRGHRSRANSFESPEDTIMAQAPPPGISVNRNNCIDLLVSAGRYREAFAMPDLTALPVDDAILVIEAHKLRIGNINEAADRDFPVNTVAGQTPPAGYRVVEDRAIQLGVNRPGTTAQKALRSGQAKTFFFHHRVGAGFLNRHIKIRISSKVLSYDLFDDFMAPGGELLFFIPRFENIAVMLYEDGELIKTILPGDNS